MFTRIVRVFAVLSVLLGSHAVAQSMQIPIDDGRVTMLELVPGRTVTIETDADFGDILIGDAAIVDVFPLTDRSLYIQAKTPGVTNVTLYSAEKQLLEVIDVRVELDFSDVERAIRGAVPGAHVHVSNVNSRIRLSGEVRDNVALERAVEIAQQFSEQPVINGLRVLSAQQIELDVRILEVERNSGRAFGVDLTGTAQDGTQRLNSGNGGTTSLGQPFGTVVGELLEVSGVQIDFVINALESKGLARRLANPKLVATSGIEADFVVGGEVPISVTTTGENGNVSTSTGYRSYGVRLTFLPEVLDNELIRLRIQPEVSDIDSSTTVNGQPAFITRTADTTVSLRNGQSFAIAGLLQSNNARNLNQFPWLGQIPVLGTLFSSRNFQRRETDLVILVTPRMVQPVGPDTPLATPLDRTRPSNDVELFLLGMVEVDRDLLRGFRDGRGIAGSYGHMMTLDLENGASQ